jgi:hypothetical protein
MKLNVTLWMTIKGAAPLTAGVYSAAADVEDREQRARHERKSKP